jgi:hypothetical protein
MELEDVKAFIAANQWKFASTMAFLPHWYVVRGNCGDAEFVAFAQYIREHGEERRFGKRMFTYLDLDGFSYWTMGNPLPETTIINRAKLHQ